MQGVKVNVQFYCPHCEKIANGTFHTIVCYEAITSEWGAATGEVSHDVQCQKCHNSYYIEKVWE